MWGGIPQVTRAVTRISSKRWNNADGVLSLDKQGGRPSWMSVRDDNHYVGSTNQCRGAGRNQSTASRSSSVSFAIAET